MRHSNARSQSRPWRRLTLICVVAPRRRSCSMPRSRKSIPNPGWKSSARLHILRGRAAIAQHNHERVQGDIDVATRLLASLPGYPLEEANLEALRVALLLAL